MIKIRRLLKSNGNFGIRFNFQLISTFMLICVGALIITGGIFYSKTVELIKQRSEEDSILQLGQLEHNITIFTNEVEYMSQSLMLEKNYGRLLNGTYGDEAEKVLLTNMLFDSIENILLSYEYIDSIYYYGSQGVVFGASQNSHRYSENGLTEDPFYKNDLWFSFMGGDKKLYWAGGCTASYFGFYNTKQEDIPYISLLRKINFDGKNPALLIMNIREDYFQRIYNNISKERPGQRYIINEHNTIISSKTNINTSSSYVKESLDAGTIETVIGEEKYQVVFFKLKDKMWTIADETPIAYLEKDARSLKDILIIILVIGAVAAMLNAAFWIHRITSPLSKLVKAMKKTEEGNLGVVLDNKTTLQLGILGRQFNTMSCSIKQLMEKIKVVEEDKRSYEIEALWAQINPHFIYNTLNVIKWMSVIAHTDNITQCIQSLGHILHPIFNRNSDYCTVGEELEYIGHYIIIMNYRYGNTIKLTVTADEEIRNNRILRMVIQPVLENSIIHGKAESNSSIHISITVYKQEGGLYFIITDDGVGITEESLSFLQKSITENEDKKSDTRASGKYGIGIVNVNRRIQLSYGDKYGVHISSQQGKGTVVTILLPISMEHKIIPEQ